MAKKKTVHVGKKGGRGSHGHVTKAGKVRQQTPQIPPQEHKKKPIPRIKHSIRFKKLISKKLRRLYAEDIPD